MGVPELLKFAAKAPGALTRLRQQGGVHTFEYVMIDGTNTMQTVGADAVVALLKSGAINITEGVYVLLDSQRDRSGTAREQRSHLSAHSLDVGAQNLCSALASVLGPKSVKVFLSGRDIEGEADYKLLHLQRGLTAAAKAQNKPIPRFLFVSEDSDVLAGALCGPAPGNSWIATRLRDATQELCLLSVEVVTAWLTGVGKKDIAIAAPAPVDVTPAEDIAEVEPQVESRHKKDGPMVGMGTATYFADSDDEVLDESAAKVAPASIAVPKANVEQTDRARRQQSASMDLILLFLLLKGSGYLAPVVKGATKVDMSSIWTSYMKVGRSVVCFEGNSIRYDGGALAKILQSSHLFDSMSRPANSDEINAAAKYLSAVTRTLARGIIAFRGPRGCSELLDSRSDSIVEAPTLAAFYALLDLPDRIKIPMTVLFPVSVKAVANPIEESMMLVGVGATRPTPAPHALPSLKVGVVQSLSTASITSLIDLYLEITMREALSTTTQEEELGSGATFSFDLRRMVAVDAPAQQQSVQAVLAAAGLSTGYSYAIDPAKVLARSRPNQKHIAVTSTPADLATQTVVPEIEVNHSADAPKIEHAQPKAVKGEGARATATKTGREGNRSTKQPSTPTPVAARKGKKRLGKKERVLLAKKLNKGDKN